MTLSIDEALATFYNYKQIRIVFGLYYSLHISSAMA